MRHFIIVGILICGIHVIAAADVRSEFEAVKIKPDIIDTAPTDKIEVKYGDKVVDLGNELTPTETQQVPEIHYKHEGGVLYTLVMTGKPEFRSSRSETDKI